MFFLHFLKYYQPPGGLLRCRLRIGLALFRISLRAPSCGKAGRLAGRGARAAEVSSAEDEKDLLVRPLGRAKGGSPGLALGFRNAMFPSCWRLSPLFYQDAQIFIFPAPISCLGEGCISQLIPAPEPRADACGDRSQVAGTLS
jgi:hypothetical protein